MIIVIQIQNIKVKMSQDSSVSPNQSLQVKQKYLRQHINQQQYQDFYEFCENQIGNLNVNAWSMQYTEQIVRKYHQFHQQQIQRENNQENGNKAQISYYQYQTKENQNLQPVKGMDNILQQLDDDDCKSSKVAKSSAMDLLDQAFETSSMSSNKNPNQKKQAQQASFDDFQFWTTGALNSNKDNRRNSSAHFATNAQSSPRVPNIQNKSSTAQQNLNLVVSDQSKVNKKSSPYAKKSHLDVPYEAQSEYYTTKQIQQIRQQKHKNIKASHSQQKEKRQYPNSKVIKVKQVNLQAKQGSKDKWIVQENVFNELVPCFKSTIRTQLATPKLNISIDNKHQIIHRSFLAPDYAMYTIKITPLGIECKRNYQDFVRLKKNLQKFFPGMHLAYLQEPGWFSGTDETYLSYQKKMLQFFLRDLLKNKQIKNSRIMQDFLTLKDHKSIKRKFEKYDKMQNLKGIEQLCLLDGHVQVTISNQQGNYINYLNKFIQKMNDLFQKQRKMTDYLIKQYENLMETYTGLMKITLDMESQLKKFNSKVTLNQVKYLGNVLKIVRQTYKQELSNAKFQYKIQNKKIAPFLKYEHQNILQFKDLLYYESKFTRSYEKRGHYQKVGYSQTYNSEQTMGMKKGVLDQSKSYLVMKYQTGYLSHQCRVQGQRIFDQMAQKIFEKWQFLGTNYTEKLNKNIDYWNAVTSLDKKQIFDSKA